MKVEQLLNRNVNNEAKPQVVGSKVCDFDLVIVGGGIIGLVLACALKNSRLRIALVEAQVSSVAAIKGQAYAVTLLSSQILRGMGIWEQVADQVVTCREVRLSDANCSFIVRFLPKDLGTDAVVHVAEHTVLLNALQECLRGCSNVTYLCPAEVKDVRYQAEAAELDLVIGNDRSTLRTQLVVAADGAKSRLRQAAGIRTRGWQYWQSCIACVVKPELPHGSIAYERFWPSGPFGILPLPDNLCRIVWTAPHAEAQALMALDDKQFLTELSQRYGSQMGRLSLVGDRFLFPVQLMQSDRYTLPRLALVGDAAHCCHPVGGQGLNLGIRDAAALAEVLQMAHQQGKDIGQLAVLRQYERWRKPENLIILGLTDFLDRCFSSNWLPLVLFRRLGLWLLQTLQPGKSLALRVMTGLIGRTPGLAQP